MRPIRAVNGTPSPLVHVIAQPFGEVVDTILKGCGHGGLPIGSGREEGGIVILRHSDELRLQQRYVMGGSTASNVEGVVG